MNKLTKYVLGTFLGIMTIGSTVFASEYTVTDADTVLYTNANAIMYTQPDGTSIFMTAEQVQDGLPIKITGTTSNGYYRADVGANIPFYFNANGMSATQAEATANQTTPTVSQAITQNGLPSYAINPITGKVKYRYEDFVDGCGITYILNFKTGPLPVINSDTDPFGCLFQDTPEWQKARIEAAIKSGYNKFYATRVGYNEAKALLAQYGYKMERYYIDTTMKYYNINYGKIENIKYNPISLDEYKMIKIR